MRILAIADRQFNLALPEYIAKNAIDLVLLLGDLKFIDICDLAEVKIPILGVYGNHCSGDYFPEIKAKNAHLTEQRIQGYSFLGFEGCPYYKGGKHEYSQEEALRLLNESNPVDILIAHSPAAGINSSNQEPHQGFDALKLYLENNSPKFFFHGHSYPPETQKVSRFNKTIVYWVEGVEVIDLNQLSLKSNLPLARSY
jgi:Icc-related predicted phosphoesterase